MNLMQYLNPKDPNQSAALYDEDLLTWAQVLADVQDLIKSLPKRVYVINACSNRYHFFVGFLAAIHNRCITLLPANHLPKTLENLSVNYPDVVCLNDQNDLYNDIPVLSCCYNGKLTAESHYVQLAAPAIEAEICIAFTSGTTGEPKPYTKTWQSLITIAKHTNQRLALDYEEATVVATVPPQHMFGLEASIMLPWQGGYLLDAQVPFYPGDIIERLKEISGTCVLVSTPAHLGILVKSVSAAPKIECVISATAPLAHGLSEEIEQNFTTRLLEIYGSTETGTLATRWTTKSNTWFALPGIKLISQDQEIINVHANYFASPMILDDELKLFDAHSFEFLRRSNDLIKVGGKRASLLALNDALCSIDGVEEGVFYQPNSVLNITARLVVFVVASNHSDETIRAALRCKVEAVFLPRSVIFLKKLPKNKLGKIPQKMLKKLWGDFLAEKNR